MAAGSDASKAYAPWLWILTLLFAVRVSAQPLSLVWDKLPAFSQWQSGALPYGWLLFFQIVILTIMVTTALRYSRGGVRASRRAGQCLLTLGGLYMTAMLVRFALGQSSMQSHDWFDRPLPTVFHLVLAGFVLTAGLFHFRNAVNHV